MQEDGLAAELALVDEKSEPIKGEFVFFDTDAQGKIDTDHKIHRPPDDWQPKPLKGNEPAFSSVDNPGGWDPYIFTSHFKNKAKTNYTHHQLPTGARPVPEDPITKK